MRSCRRAESGAACARADRSWFSTLMRAVYSATVARSSSWVAASAWLAAMACALLWRPELEAEAAAERASSSASCERGWRAREKSESEGESEGESESSLLFSAKPR